MCPCYSSKVYGCYLLVGYGRPYLIPPAEMSRIYVRHALSMEFLVKQRLDLFIHLRGSPRLLVEGIMPPCVFLSPSSVSCEGSFV
jgi:hypothetical protein